MKTRIDALKELEAVNGNDTASALDLQRIIFNLSYRRIKLEELSNPKEDARYETTSGFIRLLNRFTPEERLEIFKDKDQVQYIYESTKGEEIFPFYLTPTEVLTFCETLQETDSSYNLLPVIYGFCCIKDFDNPTYEELLYLYRNKGNRIYGDILERLLNNNWLKFLKDLPNDIFCPNTLDNQTSQDFIIKLLTERKEVVKGLNHTKLCLTTQKFISLCEARPEYCSEALDFLKYQERGFANKLYKQTDVDKFYRYLFIIADCCINHEIPAYQAAKLKEYAVLLKVYHYNFRDIAAILVNSRNSDNSLEQVQNKTTKTVRKVKKYILMYNDKYELYDTVEERNIAKIKLLEDNPDIKVISSELLVEGE